MSWIADLAIFTKESWQTTSIILAKEAVGCAAVVTGGSEYCRQTSEVIRVNTWNLEYIGSATDNLSDSKIINY